MSTKNTSFSKTKFVVTGANSVLGRDILNILAESGVIHQNVTALENSAAIGDTASFGEEVSLTLHNMEGYDFKGTQIVLHAGEARDSAAVAKKAAAVGAYMIDGSGVFAFDPDVPVVVPEVNADALQKLPKKIIANPNSISIFLALALKPLHDHAGIIRVVASTYQAVSHWGRPAQEELFSQTKTLFMAQTVKHEHMPKQIAFNCYPMVGHEREDGHTDVEFQTMGMIKKILDSKIKIAINTVTVPCFVGDGLMVNVECRDEITPIKAAMWMTAQKALGVLEESDHVPTHSDITGEGLTFVARLRQDFSIENGLSFWLMGDNLQKGSALNMVDIARAVAGL